MNNEDICSSETVSGGENVFRCDSSDVSSADHLVVMINGILGSSADWKFGAEQFVKSLLDRVFVHQEPVTGLSRVLWEKVDVSFHNSRSRFAAHRVIQVKNHNRHADGADVIQHMIDHFCLL